MRTRGRVVVVMTKAIFDGVVLAESDDVRVVDGLSYFPIESVDRDRLTDSTTTSMCPWKGTARYFNVSGTDRTAADAAFAYPDPRPKAVDLVTDRIAFWREVEIAN